MLLLLLLLFLLLFFKIRPLKVPTFTLSEQRKEARLISQLGIYYGRNIYIKNIVKTLTNLLIDLSLLFSLHTHSRLCFQSFINFLFPRFHSDYNVISAIILSCNAHLIIFTCILRNINIKLLLLLLLLL